MDRRFLLAQAFGNFVAARRTLKRGVRDGTALRKSRIARAPNKRMKHPFNGTPRVRV
jgi:hypothetical protein